VTDMPTYTVVVRNLVGYVLKTYPARNRAEARRIKAALSARFGCLQIDIIEPPLEVVAK